LKVLLIADNLSYQIFYQYDPDFRKVFKVKADFEPSMERDDRGVAWYASFIARLARDERLPISTARRPPLWWKRG
jgi:predicted ATP-dependent protease